MLQSYLIYFDPNITKIQAEIIPLNATSADILDREISSILQSEAFEFYEYSEDIVILVDDRGFEKDFNPVFEITSAFGDTVQLAGRLLFVRNIENEFSTDITNITDEDISYLRSHLQIKLLGILNKKEN